MQIPLFLHGHCVLVHEELALVKQNLAIESHLLLLTYLFEYIHMVPISKCFIFLFGCVNERKSIRTKWLCRKVKISVTFFYSFTRNYKSVSSQHNNPLCRIVPIENIQEYGKLHSIIIMTRKNREMTFLFSEPVQ